MPLWKYILSKRETLETAGGGDVLMKHNVQDSIRVEIKRI